MCNKKVVGITLLVIGIVLIAIGIIIGLLLPSIAFKEVEKTTCVNSKDSAGYERWVSKMYLVQYQLLSYPPYGARKKETGLPPRSVGRVGGNPGNEVGTVHAHE